MTNKSQLTSFFKNQAALASVIGNGIVTPAIRLRAYRIWHGIIKPNSSDMNLINSATAGAIDANYFHGIQPIKAIKRKPQ